MMPETKTPSSNESQSQVNHASNNSGMHGSIFQQMGSNASSLFLNPHAVAQAASVALAAAAQQVAQQQQHQQQQQQQQHTPNNHNIPAATFPLNSFISKQNTDSENPMNVNSHQTNQQGMQPASQTNHKLNGTMSSLPESVKSFLANPQQLAFNAQAAALFAAGGVNPALLLSSGNAQVPAQAPAHTPAMAAAQAFAKLLQQQQQQPQPQQSSQPRQGIISNVSPHFQEQQNSTKTTNTPRSSPSPMVQHFNHSSQGQNVIFNGRSQQIKPIGSGSESMSSSSISYNTATEKRAKTDNHNVTSLIAVNSPSTQTNQQQGNANSLYATSSNNPMFFAQMQSWKLEQLEAYVKLLHETNQPTPQPVSLLLTEARRREDKRTAKRVANRKSACTSRARKKAFVEEMTRTNARLKRQAVILSLLPDLVMAIKLDGEISFCSAQVGRVLCQNVDNLVGATINDILVPNSQKEIAQLIDKLVAAEKAALDENNKEGDESRRSSNSGNNSSAAVVSEQSDQCFPPLSVVKVNSCSSVSNQTHRDDVTGALVTANNAGARLSSLQHYPDKKKLDSDVADRSVSPARLPSLQNGRDEKKSAKMSGSNFESQEDVSSSASTDSLFAGVEDKRKNRRGNGNSSDDSGYRQSVESGSREDSSSTDTSNGGRPRPLAPTCNICLIRNDLSTIWCEVTSSIRTRSLNEENSDAMIVNGSSTSSEKKKCNSANTSNASETASEDDQVKELLLCLRPIRDGKKVGSKLKFPIAKSDQESLLGNDAVVNKKSELNKIRPMKKRPLPLSGIETSCKKAMVVKSGSEAEKSVVESLILMSGHKR